VSEAFRRKTIVGGMEFVRHGDVLWAEGDGALWTCPKCGDGRAIANPRDHVRWHGPRHPWRTRGQTDRAVEAVDAALREQEAIDDD
jgi:hypothetical protein